MGGGRRLLVIFGAVLAFLVLAWVYNLVDWQGFFSEEAFENAQLARNIAQGRGFVTQSVRPLCLRLLQLGGNPANASTVLQHPTPDIGTPPVYPLLLAALLKVSPAPASEAQWSSYAPERSIAALNELFFFLAVILLFRLAARLFDPRVAWLSAVLLAGTNLFWRFSLTALPTCWLLLVFVTLATVLASVEDRVRNNANSRWAAVRQAGLAGVVLGVGGLSLYAFAWLFFPALAFLIVVGAGRRKALCGVFALGFFVVMTPWLMRNVALVGPPFGDRTFAVLQGTISLPGETLERSFNPGRKLREASILQVINKFIENEAQLWRPGAPRLTGNWIEAFFLVGLMVRFEAPGRRRLRWFLAGALVMFLFIQPLGQTHLSSDSPDINSENLLPLCAPLVFVFGAALFFTLLDPWETLWKPLGRLAPALLALILCAPLLLALALGNGTPVNRITPYSPLQIRMTAHLFAADELLCSDIPSAVAWYGERRCAWLPLDPAGQFAQLNRLQPVKGLYLTQRTSNERLLTQMALEPSGWGHFFYQCQAHDLLPPHFPLSKSPAGLLPYQLLLSDRVRWQ